MLLIPASFKKKPNEEYDIFLEDDGSMIVIPKIGDIYSEFKEGELYEPEVFGDDFIFEE
jgi:hypothetical protein